MFRKLWQRLFPPPLVLSDPFFGRLLFMRMPDPNNSYWEGNGRFAPADAEIEYFVDAGEEGPGPTQREFYRQLEGRYNVLRASLAPVLSRAYADWFRRPAPVDVWSVFSLNCLSVPRAAAPECEWDMSFDCADDREHLFTVRMRGWEPLEPVGIDG